MTKNNQTELISHPRVHRSRHRAQCATALMRHCVSGTVDGDFHRAAGAGINAFLHHDHAARIRPVARWFAIRTLPPLQPPWHRTRVSPSVAATVDERRTARSDNDFRESAGNVPKADTEASGRCSKWFRSRSYRPKFHRGYRLKPRGRGPSSHLAPWHRPSNDNRLFTFGITERNRGSPSLRRRPRPFILRKSPVRPRGPSASE